MDVYVARQPIFDRQMNIFGYELLYRSSKANYFIETDDDIATAELICNSFMVVGLSNLTDGKKAFINFSKDLIDSEVPFLLPQEDVVIEILEREPATQATVDACIKARERGYQIALDDYVVHESFLPLMDLVDIIKVEYPSVSYEDQRRLVRQYRHKKIKLLAEKIETREDYQKAVELGYDYFQGYFFSKPTMVQSREIVSLQSNLFDIVEELHQPEPRYCVIADIVRGDLGLTYKLLMLANSAYNGARCKIHSISQAIAYIGTKELCQWISIMLIKEMKNVENAELIKQSLIRGKLMESIARELCLADNTAEYFLTGMFSTIDVILNKPMVDILRALPFSDEVGCALLGGENGLGRLLHCVIAFEEARWDTTNNCEMVQRVGAGRLMELYADALRWARRFDAR